MIHIKKYINYKNYKKLLLIDLGLIIMCIFVLVISNSNAYYNDRIELKLLGGKVGDFYKDNSDLSVTIFLENKSKNGNYYIADSIPTVGYKYSKYECLNNNDLIYDEKSKNYTISALAGDHCKLYFDYEYESDISIQIYKETNENEYEKVFYIPIYGYKYSNYNCDNLTSITYDENKNKLYFSAPAKDHCSVYFSKDLTSLNANIYIMKKEKIEDISIFDPEKKYVVNEQSKCYLNNEQIDGNINFINNKLIIDITNKDSICDVILEEVSND